MIKLLSIIMSTMNFSYLLPSITLNLFLLEIFNPIEKVIYRNRPAEPSNHHQPSRKKPSYIPRLLFTKNSSYIHLFE